MNCQAFTNDSLTMMYEAIRVPLAADDALKRQGLAIRFRRSGDGSVCGLLRDCTGWYRTDPGDFQDQDSRPFRSVDPDAFVGVNAQLN